MGKRKVERTKDAHRAVGRQYLAEQASNALEQHKFDRMVATWTIRGETPKGVARPI